MKLPVLPAAAGQIVRSYMGGLPPISWPEYCDALNRLPQTSVQEILDAEDATCSARSCERAG